MGEVSYNFKDKVVLVTGNKPLIIVSFGTWNNSFWLLYPNKGSASGIGEATVVLFARAGAKIVIVDIDLEGIARVAERCFKESPYGYKVSCCWCKLILIFRINFFS